MFGVLRVEGGGLKHHGSTPRDPLGKAVQRDECQILSADRALRSGHAALVESGGDGLCAVDHKHQRSVRRLEEGRLNPNRPRFMSPSPKKVLIVTTAVDPHADAVIDQLEELGAAAFRVNSEDLLSSYVHAVSCTSRGRLSGTIIDSTGRTISVDNVQAAYYRKPERVVAVSGLPDQAVAEWSAEQGEELLRTLYALPDVPWINDPFAIRRAQPKLPQLQVASQFGLRVPRTVVTNDPKRARQFCLECDDSVIVKSLSNPVIERPEGSSFIYTHKLARSEIEEHIEGVRFAPTLLQEWIPKQTEIRATVIGRQVFACEIESQSVPDAIIDWRAASPDKVPHHPTDLPDMIERAIVELVAHYGLQFGAIDLIRTPSNEYVFLENNPNGQWYWIELLTGIPMAAAMARLLVKNDR